MRRRFFFLTLAPLVALIAAPPVAAADPAARSLTVQEQRASDRRVAAADRYLADADVELGLAATCPTATGSDPSASATCEPPSGTLSVEARDQLRNIYCGPATGQVIANYTWAVGAGQNRFTQDQIATWMSTNINGGTDAFNLERGLERATAGAPRRPANWDWVVINLRDHNGNGLVGDELHGYARSNISGSRMALAVPVKPHEPQAAIFLSSWPREVRSVGHWIPIYGWIGIYDGSDSALLRYTDSSRDEGGSTGKFLDPTRHLAILIMQHTQRLVW
jgi:hypothetical protein